MSIQNNICPLCGEGHLQQHADQEEVEYKGRKGITPLYYSECDVCGSEQADAIQTRNNKRAMLAFKKQVDGLLTGVEIKELRLRFGISQNQAATIFGGGPVAFSKYENDDVMQSEPMDKLLRVAKDVPAAFKYLAQKAGIYLAGPSPSIDKIISAHYVSVSESLKPDKEVYEIIRPNLRLVHSSRTVPEPTMRYGYERESAKSH